MCTCFSFRYGPSTSKLSEKLFKNDKTDIFYGGMLFTARSASGKGGVGSSSKSSKSKTAVVTVSESRLFVPGAKDSAEKVGKRASAQREGRTGGVAVGGAAMEPLASSAGGVIRQTRKGGVVTQEGTDLQ